MVLDSYDAPEILNLTSSISNWLFLAGFVVIPGTFRNLGYSFSLGETEGGRFLQSAIRNSTLGISCVSSSFGGIGITWAGWKMRRNHIWLIDHVYL